MWPSFDESTITTEFVIVVRLEKCPNIARCVIVLTVIHTKLDCDTHQAECRRLQSAYDSLGYRYKALQTIDEPTALLSGLRELDAEQAGLRAEVKATPPQWVFVRAEKSQGGEAPGLKVAG